MLQNSFASSQAKASPLRTGDMIHMSAICAFPWITSPSPITVSGRLSHRGPNDAVASIMAGEQPRFLSRRAAIALWLTPCNTRLLFCSDEGLVGNEGVYLGRSK